jgi:hypothetical protein
MVALELVTPLIDNIARVDALIEQTLQGERFGWFSKVKERRNKMMTDQDDMKRP